LLLDLLLTRVWQPIQQILMQAPPLEPQLKRQRKR
jgi:hypothetical protein